MVDDSMTTTPQKKPVFHGRYGPSSRIILKSSDDQLFSVSRSFLVKNSVFFRDLFKLPRPGVDLSTQPKGPEIPKVVQFDEPSGPQNLHPRLSSTRRDTAPRITNAAIGNDDSRGMIEPSHESDVRMADVPTSSTTGVIEITVPPIQTHIDDNASADKKLETEGMEEGEEEPDKVEEHGDQRGKGQHEDGGKHGDPWHRVEERDEPKKSARAPQPDPLELDTDWSTLAFFLDVLTIAQFSNRLISIKALELNIGQIRQVLPLVKKFDCEKAAAMLRARLEALAMDDPWAVLTLASNEEDVGLGKVAIGFMSTYHDVLHPKPGTKDDGTRLWRELEALRPAWQLAFLKCFAPTTELYHDSPWEAHSEPGGNLRLVARPGEAARAFHPVFL